MTRPEAVQMVSPALHSGQLLDYVNIFIDRKKMAPPKWKSSSQTKLDDQGFC
jgi:hypothetical protein